MTLIRRIKVPRGSRYWKDNIYVEIINFEVSSFKHKGSESLHEYSYKLMLYSAYYASTDILIGLHNHIMTDHDCSYHPESGDYYRFLSVVERQLNLRAYNKFYHVPQQVLPSEYPKRGEELHLQTQAVKFPNA